MMGKEYKHQLGRIGGGNVLASILHSTFESLKDFLLQSTPAQIKVETAEGDCVELKSPLSQVIEIFKRTRFALVPIIGTARVDNNSIKPIILGTISIKDFLPLIANKRYYAV